MNYELAKQLKDMGFPLREHSLNEYATCERCDQTLEKECDPTLSELIEACGLGFNSLTQYQKPIGTITKYAATKCYPLPSITVYGDTPEEAVALLWLALNKKEPRAT